jgi:hypothetical protein
MLRRGPVGFLRNHTPARIESTRILNAKAQGLQRRKGFKGAKRFCRLAVLGSWRLCVEMSFLLGRCGCRLRGFQVGTPRRGVRSSRRDDPTIRVISRLGIGMVKSSQNHIPARIESTRILNAKAQGLKGAKRFCRLGVLASWRLCVESLSFLDAVAALHPVRGGRPRQQTHRQVPSAPCNDDLDGQMLTVAHLARTVSHCVASTYGSEWAKLKFDHPDLRQNVLCPLFSFE